MSQESRGRVLLDIQPDDPGGSVRLEFYDTTEEERRQVFRALEALYQSVGGDGLVQIWESHEDVPDDLDVPGISVDLFIKTVEVHLAKTGGGTHSGPRDAEEETAS
jgi:hypothetical protein